MKRLPAPFPFINQNKKTKLQTYTRPSHYQYQIPSVVQEESEKRTTRSYIPGCKPASSSGYVQPWHDQVDKETHHHQWISKPDPGSFHHGSCSSRQPLREINMQELPTQPNKSAIKQSKENQSTQPTSRSLAHFKNQTRVITTTSQGVQYWSQYKNHCHLLFEIYGLLDSQVSTGAFGCQQFMLKTTDGIIKCQFWEIDQKLNRLYKGKSYRHPAAVVFWQWINQSFNAIVNYTNRSGDEPITKQQLMVPYIAATSCATATAVGLNILTRNLPPLIGRFVPFAAVAAANCINIPLMRQREIQNGIPITDEEGNKVGMSKNAAKKAITQVAFSRIGMAMPGMVIPAVIMNTLDKRNFFKRIPWAPAPMQVGLVGFCLAFATPLCCAIFPQQSSIKVSSLEPEVKEKVQAANPGLNRVFFNKGL